MIKVLSYAIVISVEKASSIMSLNNFNIHMMQEPMCFAFQLADKITTAQKSFPQTIRMGTKSFPRGIWKISKAATTAELEFSSFERLKNFMIVFLAFSPQG